MTQERACQLMSAVCRRSVQLLNRPIKIGITCRHVNMLLLHARADELQGTYQLHEVINAGAAAHVDSRAARAQGSDIERVRPGWLASPASARQLHSGGMHLRGN